ncbi:TolC family protein [Pedobacter sp. UBA5917]|uniref:TolC family protein n=1 Tax=Pedobacter sp. UBA5917 TaxID=1947061 RepID=UPI0025CCE330|nr:TolC family protein [Pedobacter sp. UBA5917]
MEHYKSMAFLGTILFLSAQAVKAQVADSSHLFTLEDVWKIAGSQNKQLKLSDLSLKQSRINVLEAKDRLLPDLNIGGDLKLNTKFLIYDKGLFSAPQDVPVSDYGYNLGYNFNLNLFNGGKDRRNVEIKRTEADRMGHEVELQRSNIKYNTAVAYYDLYKFLQFRDFIASEISAKKKQHTLIENLNKNGIVLKSDVLRSSVKLSELGLNLSDVDKKILLAKQRLNILMGLDDGRSLEIPYKKDIALQPAIDSVYDDYLRIALNQSPQLKVASSDIKLSELNIRQAKSTLLPKVSLYSTYGYTYPQVSFYPYSNDLWGYGQTGIKMQFSIDNLFKAKHSIANALNVGEQQNIKSGIKKEEISIQVREAYLQELQAREGVGIAEKNIIENTETVRVIRNSYLNQESLLTDLLDAENMLLQANLNLTASKVALKLSHIRLLAIIGIL